MATLTSTGRFAAGEACADNDIFYGPYATIAAAHAALLNAERNVVGRTVGIQTGNTIEEYWYQGGTNQENLVKKQSSEVEANPTGAATTTLTKIKIGETNYNIPQTDTSGLATKQELQQGLSVKQDTISAIAKISSDFVDDTNKTNKFVTSNEKGLIGTAVQNITRGGSTLTKENGVVDIPEEIEDVVATPVAAGGSPTVDLTNGTLTLGIPRGADGQDGADAVNPFKGWFDAVVTGEAGSRVITSETQNLPANPIIGDYAYVKTWEISGTAPSQTETPIARIYECTTAGSWSDSGRTADTSNVQTFASGEEVNEISIDNDFVGGSDKVAGAEEVKELKGNIDDIAFESEDLTYIRIVSDNEGRLLYGVKADGEFVFGKGCPKQVKDYIDGVITDNFGDYDDIVTFLDDYLEGDETLKNLIDGKVDKVEGKGIIPTQYADEMSSDTLIQVVTDADGRILESINSDGEKHISKFDEDTQELIKEIAEGSGGDTVGGNYINITMLDANFTSPVPVTITGTKGSDNAQYAFDLPLSEDAFNIRFKFRITENLLALSNNTEKTIATLGGTTIVKAKVQALAQDTSTYTIDNETKISYWPSFTGGIRLNGSLVGGKRGDHNIGTFAFYVKYTGSTSDDVTISNDGTAITISVNGNDTVFSFTDYPTVSDLYEAIKAMNDIEVSYNELEGRYSNELAKFPAVKLVSSYYSTLNGGRESSDIAVEYSDAAPLFIPYAVSEKWHRVEVTKIGSTIYVVCDGDVVTRTGINGNTLNLGGNCGVLFKDFEVYTDSSYDAEIIDGILISSMNPYIIIYECHGIDKNPSCESTTTGNLNTTVDRLQYVYSYIKTKGYVPVSIVDIADYYSGDKQLPKRCFTTVFDGYRFVNVMDLENRAVFTRMNALSALAIATSEAEPIYHNGVEITEDVAAKICKNNGFDLISHSHDHRHFTGVKPSTYMEHLAEDIYSADLLDVIGNIIVFPFGENNLYTLDTMKWMGFRLGIGVASNNTLSVNNYGNSRYLLIRYEIGMRSDMATILEVSR